MTLNNKTYGSRNVGDLDLGIYLDLPYDSFCMKWEISKALEPYQFNCGSHLPDHNTEDVPALSLEKAALGWHRAEA